MDKAAMIAEKVFPESTSMSIADIERRYPPRNLPDGQMVTRLAPSPTGFMHIGTVYMGLINVTLAKQSGGVSMLRVEDTDQKRQVENGVNIITSACHTFGIDFDEGQDHTGQDHGNYAPYVQSERKGIYQAYAKKLLAEKKAYPCFCSTEHLDGIRQTQTLRKERTGYYGAYAECRRLTDDQVLKNLEEKKPFVLRMVSNGDNSKRMQMDDIVRGRLHMPQNDIDPVIMKADDGLPTYHFAHVVDDHLMGTTHVIRGDEWLSSLPLHLEMFSIMGWQPPQYAHMSPIQKMDGTSKRKLSKRKDPEANIEYFFEQGYPVDAITEYLLNLANSDFEDWRSKNPDQPTIDFKLDLTKTSPSGALFDTNKLNSISKRVISEYTKDKVYDLALEWSGKYDHEFHQRMTSQAAYFKNILNIERESQRKRKDIVKWSNLKSDVSYFFDDLFTAPDMQHLGFAKDVVSACLRSYASGIDVSETRDAWWEKVKQAAEANRFATDMKKYKENKQAFNGSVADFMKIIRYALTGREDSPDVYEIMHVMGFDKVGERLKKSAGE